MTMAAGMPSLSRVSLHDKLPDEPAERRKCATCSAWRNTCEPPGCGRRACVRRLSCGRLRGLGSAGRWDVPRACVGSAC